MERRFSISKDINVTTSATTTDELDIAEFSAGQIQIKTGALISSLTYYASNKVGGTFMPAQDAAGSDVVQAVSASNTYPIPAILFGAYALRIVADAAGVLSVCLKS